MIYPNNFEQKIGFDYIRHYLREHCLSQLGHDEVDNISFSTDADSIRELLQQTKEMRQILDTADDFPLRYFFDMREVLHRLRLEGTHADEGELHDMSRSLQTIVDIVAYLTRSEGDDVASYPALSRMAADVSTFPSIVKGIERIIDKYGKMRDNASPELARIRSELAKTGNSISRTLYNILRAAQSEGLIDKDVTPAMRDGRLVLPIAPSLKRRVKGIVHDESATGKTVYVEPTEVVEANNRIRELESEERREIIRILTAFANEIRPYVDDMLGSYKFMAKIDLLYAKTELAKEMNAIEPQLGSKPHLDWRGARHPILESSLNRQNKKIVPLDIMLTRQQHLLIISGPNAGGKSVCLKTAGLLQYMLQCGLSIPVGERSTTGIFANIMLDIGDEQSISDDLSTYSSHLMNMKQMMRRANNRTLLLIDEFGGGTEPTIGGAIAEAVLKQFLQQEAWGIITTHYQNLKHFADGHEGIVNGAMLYDRNEMRPLFELQIGRPGSSFAIEIARKIGLPKIVIDEASEIVGSDYIHSDKYLQDIVRDKRYWETKRQNIHQREKDIEKTISRYENEVEDLNQNRKDILRKAKEQAEELLRETNKRIENAIREIREKQAEKEATRQIREELNNFKAQVADLDTKANDDKIEKKIRQIQQRRERQEKRKKQKAENKAEGKETKAVSATTKDKELAVGDTVRIKGLTSVGQIESIEGKMCTVIFGDMRTKMRLERLEAAEAPRKQEHRGTVNISRTTRETIDNRRQQFHQDLDVRGMRGDEAINAVMYFIDDAVLVGMSQVRILHGTGNGILRQLIRQYLSTLPHVSSFRDEHVQFGGAGITVVTM